MGLSKLVVKYCQGNPLALVVLGCFLYGRGKEEWESALDKLNQTPSKDIIDVLKLSFDVLDDKQPNLFLDLAFLINARVYRSFDQIRQLYGSSVHIEMSVLRERSLISVSQKDKIGMHDLVLQMGFEIARQQLFPSPKTPVRLWRHDDIYDFLICDKEIEAIRCMSLDASKIERIKLRASNFRKMYNLIFLKVYKSDREKLQS
ncbi:disease resistance-like protein DSC1 [Neltuma alba]|uniref:disease resistance-like protein DSC1 n=1 Tax=Neltuma alba TaxID=207710 RepID=UPI0010A5933A|nr:disease resistance-like protein DSC1 [Prosopis alba]